ncbi:MAG: DUF1080 domain-containing protein [Planctomycetota bacterium]|nr:DUF1080 domain-containing protein [Planctomycetota bacterium]
MIGLLLTALQQESDCWTVEHYPLPAGEVIEVGGMDFGPEGDLWVSTRRGQVWRVSDPLGDPATAEWTLFAEGLYEGLGLNWHQGRLLVLQRGELSELLDHDGDGACDEIRTLTQDWGMSGNYHEFAFGLPDDADGNLWMSLNLGFWSPEWWHGMSKAPLRGWILRVTPDGVITPWANGARSPCGLGFGPDGNLFYTDNQGDWMPTSPIFHVERGDWFGHPASLRWTEEYGNGERIPSSTEPAPRERKPAAVWIPYKWSRSAANLFLDQSGGAFGPFSGQMIVGELTNGMLLRADLEEVQGQWQGVVWPLRQNVGSICRVAQAADGSVFCGFTNRGWGGLSPGHGLARVRFTGVTPFEVLTARATEDGFALRFTEAVDPASLTAAAARVTQYDYFDWWDYGSPQQNLVPRAVASWTPDADGLGARLRIVGLEPAMCAEVLLDGVRSATGAPLLHPEFHATLNQLPGRERTSAQVAKRVTPPEARAVTDEGWLHLTWADPFDLWNGGEGWQLVDADVDPADPRRFSVRPGQGALVNGDGRAPDLISENQFGDLEFRFSFMLPQGGDSGLYFMERYELQLVDDPWQCGGVINGKNPRQDAYRGPGQWHVATGRFYAPRFDPRTGAKTAHARFEDVALDGLITVPACEAEEITPGGLSGEAPRGALRFQGHAGRVAIGDVRVRLLEEDAQGLEWTTIREEALSAKDGAELSLPNYLGSAPHELAFRARWTGKGGAVELSPAVRIALAGGGGAEPKTGSLLGLFEIGADLIPEGVWCELRVRLGGDGVQVTLNEMQLPSAEPPRGAALLARPHLLAARGGAVEIADLRWRPVP